MGADVRKISEVPMHLNHGDISPSRWAFKHPESVACYTLLVVCDREGKHWHAPGIGPHSLSRCLQLHSRPAMLTVSRVETFPGGQRRSLCALITNNTQIRL